VYKGIRRDLSCNLSVSQHRHVYNVSMYIISELVVGTITLNGLDSPEIESRWGAGFFAQVQTGPGAHPASCTVGTVSLSRG